MTLSRKVIEKNSSNSQVFLDLLKNSVMKVQNRQQGRRHFGAALLFLG